MSLATSLTVYKLGGSLLDDYALRSTLNWIQRRQRETGRTAVLVVGGGKTADLVREWDTQFGLGDERSHWLALESLSLNESLVKLLWTGLREVRSLPQIEAAVRDQVAAIVCASCFVRWGERNGQPELPHRWDVTTDSISAWVAEITHATELVLLKSVDLPATVNIQQAADSGLIDGWFPSGAARLEKILWVNMRAEFPCETELKASAR